MMKKYISILNSLTFYRWQYIFGLDFRLREDQMNQIDLINALRTENGLSREDADVVVRLFFDEIKAALANGDRVEIRGLCSFSIKKYKAYTGRNPKTGKKVKVKSKKLPFFKCGKELKKRVDR